MDQVSVNPFDQIRASDFSDDEIYEFWVDIEGSGGLLSLIEPLSKTSKFILGGKGSGKTHLLRYCSYQVQRIRYGTHLSQRIHQDRYLGVFLRANTLDTGRFSGKGQSEDVWGTLFNYYFELCLVEQLAAICADMVQHHLDLPKHVEGDVCRSIVGLFDNQDAVKFDDFQQLSEQITRLRRQLDHAVNNCVFDRKLNVEVLVSPGRLVLGFPRILGSKVDAFRNLRFIYLIDEIENLTESQQKFLNTLLRHKESSCSFRLGARLYGVKTNRTYGAEEENKEDSEFKVIRLEALLRANRGYEYFVRRLCARRLIRLGYGRKGASEGEIARGLDGFFEEPVQDRFEQATAITLVAADQGRQRRYFTRLQNELEEGIKLENAKGLRSKVDISQLIEKLQVPEYPLLEKINIFLLYQDWYRQCELRESADKIRKECLQFIDNSKSTRYRRVFGHFRSDMLAQLYRDYRVAPKYAGLGTFIKMSSGVPRNLLVLLRNVCKWASFNGERPFREDRISIKSQNEAVAETATFFFEEDARPGREIPMLRDCIERLAELLRAARFSSKPVECSPLAFSFPLSQSSAATQHMMQLAQNWSYIYLISKGRPNKNSKRVDDKFQLNPMLSPKWDLPVVVRGDLSVPISLVEAIFSGCALEKFQEGLDNYVSGMNAPRFASGRRMRKARLARTNTLPLDFKDAR